LPKIKTQLAEATEPVEGQAYVVEAIEAVKTSVQGFDAYRVKLQPKNRKQGDDKKYATMLWKREQAGINSKLGSFLAAYLDFYGDEDVAFDTDNWIGTTILIQSWKPKARTVQVAMGKPSE